MQDYRKLRVWHLARKLAVNVIQALPPRVARKIPGLRAQAIRAANSVDSNLIEGCARATRPEFLAAVETAFASLNELEGHLSLARDAKVLESGRWPRFQDDIALVRAMLLSLIDTLHRRIAEDESARRKNPPPPEPPL